MTVGVDETGHDDGVRGIDDLGVPGSKTCADLSDGGPVDEDIGLDEVGPPHGEDAPTSDQGLDGHPGLGRSTLPANGATEIGSGVLRPLTDKSHYTKRTWFSLTKQVRKADWD